MHQIHNDKWIQVPSCPACSSDKYSVSGIITDSQYTYKSLAITIPDCKIFINRCKSCSLIFKNLVLSPKFLSLAIDKVKEEIWEKGYDYAREVKLVQKIIKKREIDILEIGATEGWFLRAFNKFEGRRSGLDITMEADILAHLRGEFIEGTIDTSNLVWSGKQYDVVGIFDVIEHLYDPRKAFTNLSLFVKNKGIVIIETGDVDSAWPSRFGVENWWYAKLFPHNMFWSKKSLIKLAEEFGFKTLFFHKKRNKNTTMIPLHDCLRSCLKSLFYWLSPSAYLLLFKMLGRQQSMPRNSLAKDHLRVVLQKKA